MAATSLDKMAPTRDRNPKVAERMYHQTFGKGRFPVRRFRRAARYHPTQCHIGSSQCDMDALQARTPPVDHGHGLR